MNSNAIERLYRRILMAIGRAIVTTSNDAGPTQSLQIRLGPDELRDNTPRLAEFGFTSMPLPGADALVVFTGGDRSKGTVIATGDQRFRMRNLKPGEVAVHDSRGQSIYLTADGIVIDGGGLPLKVTNTGGVRIEDGLTVTGDITDHCDGTGRSMASMRGVYNGHTHPDPQGGNSGVPSQQE